MLMEPSIPTQKVQKRSVCVILNGVTNYVTVNGAAIHVGS